MSNNTCLWALGHVADAAEKNVDRFCHCRCCYSGNSTGIAFGSSLSASFASAGEVVAVVGFALRHWPSGSSIDQIVQFLLQLGGEHQIIRGQCSEPC